MMEKENTADDHPAERIEIAIGTDGILGVTIGDNEQTDDTIIYPGRMHTLLFTYDNSGYQLRVFREALPPVKAAMASCFGCGTLSGNIDGVGNGNPGLNLPYCRACFSHLEI